jgi:hypothetical protein
VGYPAQKSVGLSSPEAQKNIEACGAIQPKKCLQKHVVLYSQKRNQKRGYPAQEKVCRSMWGSPAQKKSAEKRDPASTQWCQLLSLFACQPF